MDQRWPKKVLIAEDEVLICLGLVELLTEEGSEVVGQAADGEETVELTRKLEPDLIIMDMKMSGMDDITTAEIIGEERTAPILMLTAFSQSELVERAYDIGVMGYLVKSFGASEVVPVTEVTIGRFAELWAIKEELANPKDRFESRKITDQVKGILQGGLGLTELEAFWWIQKVAVDLRRSIHEVAESVISHKRKK